MTNIDGSWLIEAPSPKGKQVSTLDIVTAGATASGTVELSGKMKAGLFPAAKATGHRLP